MCVLNSIPTSYLTTCLVNLLVKILEAMLIIKIMTVSISAEAYALSWTSEKGVPNWKKMANGNVAAGRNKE